MLVCSVSLQVPRTILADIAEAAAAAAVASGHIVSTFVDIIEAADATATAVTEGNVFPVLVDDPASASDHLDAKIGQWMVEAASAAATATAGFAYAAAINEVVTAASTQDASKAGAPTTFNPSDKVNVTLSGGDLIATGVTSSGGARGTNSHSSAKHYWEYTFTTFNTNNVNLGIALATTNIAALSLVGAAVTTRTTGNIIVNGAASGSTLGALAAGNVIGIAADFTANLIWFRKAPSGNWNGIGTADPATGVGGISISSIATGAFFPFILTGVNDKITANFGATAFTGAIPSGFTSGF
jgi:hypothetical protein